MKKRTEIIAMDNVVRVSGNKSITDYFPGVVMRMSPGIYNKYGDIRIRFTNNSRRQVKMLCSYFWHCGLVPKEEIQLEKGLEMAGGVTLNKAYEIVLIKIPAIIFDNDTDFEEYWNKIIENK